MNGKAGRDGGISGAFGALVRVFSQGPMPDNSAYVYNEFGMYQDSEGNEAAYDISILNVGDDGEDDAHVFVKLTIEINGVGFQFTWIRFWGSGVIWYDLWLYGGMEAGGSGEKGTIPVQPLPVGRRVEIEKANLDTGFSKSYLGRGADVESDSIHLH